jgi:hypothetical protein
MSVYYNECFNMNEKSDYKIQNNTQFTYMPVKCQLHSADFMEQTTPF